jgi:hypothetical protein
MKKILLILLLLAGCGRDDQPRDNRAAAPDSAPSPSGRSRPDAMGKEAAATRLTGLYEGGSGAQKNQLCIVEKGREAQFGLLVWGGNLHSCSGAGRAERSGGKLTLTMTGDETCRIDATLEGGAVTLPSKLPLGCAYYCGGRASMTGARFTRSGTGVADVKKARDIAGDPLCE